MTFRWTLRTLLGWWRRHPGQLAALVAGLALATALWSAVQALNLAARDSYARAAETLGGAAVATLARPEGGTFDQSLFVALRREGWLVSPVLEGRARLDGRPVRVLGVEPVTLPPGGALTVIGAEGPDDGAALLGNPRRALVAPETLAEWGLAEGDRPVLNGAEGPALQARAGLAAGTLVMDIGQAQAALDMPGAVSRLIVPSRGAPDDATLARLTDGRLSVASDNPDADLARLTDSFHLNLTAFGLLSFVVGLFIAHAAAGLAFQQRLGVVRTLRACGAPARTVAAALLAETAALALAAGAVGMALGYGVAAALAPDVAASLQGLYGAPAAGTLTLSPLWWLSGLGMALGGGLAATGAGVWRAARLPVLAAAQSGAWAADHVRRMRAQAVAAAGLLWLAAALGAAGSGLLAGFALLATLLLGAALAAPPLLSLILGAGAARARGPVARWLWADARAGLPGLSLALMALLLALATNIGVGTMVTGFRDAFAGWLDQRLAADIYARAPDDARAAALEEAAARTDGIAAVLPTLSAEARLGGWPVEILGLADDPMYRDRWPFIAAEAGAWDAIAAGQGAAISEQLARRLRVGLGDTVTAPAADGPWPLRVVGLHPDYGNPKGQIVVGLDAMRARIPDAPRGAYAIRVAGAPVAAALGALAADPALQGVEMIDQAQVKRLSLGLFDQTFAVTGALNALTLGVAAAALFASLSTLSGMRLAQVAPLWAMGITRAQLARLEFARVMGLAALTAALAVPLGVALAWALVAVVNVQAFGWRLPLKLYPLDWLALGALALGAAALAAAGPTLRLRRTAPAALLAAFAQER
jgi:putative ABC transport system permease protein